VKTCPNAKAELIHEHAVAGLGDGRFPRCGSHRDCFKDRKPAALASTSLGTLKSVCASMMPAFDAASEAVFDTSSNL
jgi:hypothetical protein